MVPGGEGLSLRINTGNQFSTYSINRNQQDLTQSLKRISTGKKINSASDDAAGMVIANRLSTQAKGMGQAIRNAGDAASIARVADGALAQAGQLVQDIRVKAVQAAGGANSQESLNAIQADINSSLSALKELADNTTFNGRPLLSGSFSNQAFIVGPAAGDKMTLSLGSIDPAQLAAGSSGSGALSEIDVTTFEGAQAGIRMADDALQDIERQKSQVGSSVNRLESTIAGLQNSRINTLSAESEIRDLDFAEESVNLNRIKLLARARAFAQAQSGKVNQQIVDLFE